MEKPIVYISFACYSLTKAKQHHIKSLWKRIPVTDKSFGIFTTDTNIWRIGRNGF